MVALDCKIHSNDIVVNGCGGSGLVAQYGTIKVSGNNTKIENNCKDGNSSSYGLNAFHKSSSKIQIVLPLTKESISINNGGGGNWGGNGIIEQVNE